MKVVQLQNFRTQRRCKWTAKEKVLNKHGIVACGCTVVWQYPQNALEEKGIMYRATTVYEQMSVKVIMEGEIQDEW